MATATDFTSIIGQTGFVGQTSGTVTATPAPLTDSTQMVAFSKPMDQLGGTPQQVIFDSAVHAAFSTPMDTLGAMDQSSAGATHEAFDSVPRVFKMKGWSTTLGQYVHWSSVGDPFTAPPDSFGTVINITSELLA